MQSYTEISENTTLRDSRALILNNDKTAISNNQGTAFPTQDLQVGMFCFRTDERKLYQLISTAPEWKLVLDASGDTATAPNAATVNNGAIVTVITVICKDKRIYRRNMEYSKQNLQWIYGNYAL